MKIEIFTFSSKIATAFKFDYKIRLSNLCFHLPSSFVYASSRKNSGVLMCFVNLCMLKLKNNDTLVVFVKIPRLCQ